MEQVQSNGIYYGAVIPLTDGFRVLSVKEVNGGPMLFSLINPNNPQVMIQVFTVYNNQSLPSGCDHYADTIIQHGTPMHVFYTVLT
jgi:hypothetical protein